MTAWAPDARDWQQLSEPRTGRFDCTAYAAAMVVAASTGGRQRPTGREVRLATDEPVPDPASPGLNLAQARAAALRWGVALDARPSGGRPPWTGAELLAAAAEGRWAVVQVARSVLVDAGAASGFRGGHAVAVGPGPAVLDPLVPVPLRCPWPLLWRAAAALAIGPGRTVGPGRAYAAVGPVPPPAARWHVAIAARAVVQVAEMSPDGRCVARWLPRPWGRRASSAPCAEPVSRPGCSSGSATVALVTAGVFAGRWVRIAAGVTAVRS